MDTTLLASAPGVEQLRHLIFHRPRTGIGELLDMTVTEIDEGRVVIELTPNEDMLNPIGTIHGGVLASLADSVASLAVHAALGPGLTYATAQLNLHYTRPVSPTSEKIVGVGEVIHVGRSLATASATVTDETGRLVAHGTVTCAVRSLVPESIG